MFAKRARIAGLPVLWLIAAVLMVRDALADPFVAGRVGTAAYGHNGEGDLALMLAVTFAELFVLLLILRPWSYEAAWGRGLIALVLFLPWTVLSMIMTMHMGGIVTLHFFWLLCVLIVITVSVVWSAFFANGIWIVLFVAIGANIARADGELIPYATLTSLPPRPPNTKAPSLKDEDALLRSPFGIARLCAGDATMWARLDRVLATRRGLPSDGGALDELVPFECEVPRLDCKPAAARVRSAKLGAASRQSLWLLLSRCGDQFAPLFEAADAPELSFLQFHQLAPRPRPWSNRLAKLAADPSTITDAKRAQQVGLALASSRDPSAFALLYAMYDRATDDAVRAKLVAMVKYVDDTRARQLSLKACEQQTSETCLAEDPNAIAEHLAAAFKNQHAVYALQFADGRRALVPTLAGCVAQLTSSAPADDSLWTRCLRGLAFADRPRAATLAPLLTAIATHGDARELIAMLRATPTAETWMRQRWGDEEQSDIPPRFHLQTLFELLFNTERAAWLDPRDREVRPHYQRTFNTLVKLARPGIDLARIEEIQGMRGLRIDLDGKLWQWMPRPMPPNEIDFDGIVGLVNTLLKEQRSTNRCAIFADQDKNKRIACGPEPALIEAAKLALIEPQT